MKGLRSKLPLGKPIPGHIYDTVNAHIANKQWDHAWGVIADAINAYQDKTRAPYKPSLPFGPSSLFRDASGRVIIRVDDVSVFRSSDGRALARVDPGVLMFE